MFAILVTSYRSSCYNGKTLDLYSEGIRFGYRLRFWLPWKFCFRVLSLCRRTWGLYFEGCYDRFLSNSYVKLSHLAPLQFKERR